MKPEVKERVYLLVIIFCVFMCGAMIVTMLTGGRPDSVQEHTPVMREIVLPDQNEEVSSSQDTGNEQTDTENSNTDQNKDNAAQNAVTDDSETSADNSQLAITEDFINEKLEDFLPSGFPLQNPAVNIDADGIITIKGKMLRDELKEYLKQSDSEIGLKFSIALLLLPVELDVEAALLVSKGEQNMLVITPHSLNISGKDIPTDAFPKKITENISRSFNKIIEGIGDMFSFSGFEDGAILFERI